MTKKLTVIIIILLLFEALIIYTGRNGSLSAIEKGTINSLTELFTKRHAYLLLIPMILAPLGLIIRQKIGWIFTALFFYLISLTNLFAIAIQGINSTKEVPAFLVLMAIAITPLIYLNTADIKSFFKIEPSDKLIKENLTSFGLTIPTGGLFFTVNYIINNS